VFLTATLSGCAFVVVLGVVGACGVGAGFDFHPDGTSSSEYLHAAGTGPSPAASPPAAAVPASSHGAYPATDPRSVAAHNFAPSRLFEGTHGAGALGVALVQALWAFSGAMDVGPSHKYISGWPITSSRFSLKPFASSHCHEAYLSVAEVELETVVGFGPGGGWCPWRRSCVTRSAHCRAWAGAYTRPLFSST